MGRALERRVHLLRSMPVLIFPIFQGLDLGFSLLSAFGNLQLRVNPRSLKDRKITGRMLLRNRKPSILWETNRRFFS